MPLDNLESVAQDFIDCEVELSLRANNIFALLLTELIVPDCEAPLAGMWSAFKHGRHLSSPMARSPFAYILLASRPKPKNRKTMKAPASQMYRV